jgi:outer membrane lipoprotein-sorting protein
MRWLIIVVGCLVVVPAVQAQDAAQKLYEAMEQKLAEAKAHKFAFEIDGLGDGVPMKLKGAMILAAGNRLKMTIDGQVGKMPMKTITVSDGKTLAAHGELEGKPVKTSQPVDDKLFERLASWLPRAGLLLSFERIVSKNHKVPGQLKFDSKVIGKDKTGGRDALAIEYQFAFPDDKDMMNCKLWVDEQTNLPLKRILEANRDGKLVLRVVETYTQWELDPKLPEGTFTLPK